MSDAIVIVPTVRGGDSLERLLASLATDAPHVVVVDNASPDPGVATAGERFGFAEVLRLDSNLGFGRAVNRAARHAQGDAIVLVNDDCVCAPGFVAAIAGALDPGRGVVMAAGVMRAPAGTIDTAGVEVDHTLMASDHLHGEPLSALSGAPPPLGPSGAAAAFDRAAFIEAGGFDERLFAYLEDVDLALRLRLAGGDCALATGALGTHEHSGTLGAGSARKNYLAGFGRGYLLRKWGVVTPRRAPALAARELGVCAAQALFDRNLGGVRGRARGYRAATPEQPYPAELLRQVARRDGAIRRGAARFRSRRASGARS